MNAMLMILALRGRNTDPNALRAMISKANERRKKIFTKGAEILLGIVMFFFSDLKVTTSDGIDLTDPSAAVDVPTDVKINALLAAMKQTDKGNKLREVLRPMLITAAEFLAEAMNPDEMTIELLSSANAGQLGSAPVGASPMGAGSAQSVSSAFEGQFLQDPSNPRVYRIENGTKRWVTSESVMQRFGNSLVNGRWTNTNYVSGSILANFPDGAPLS